MNRLIMVIGDQGSGKSTVMGYLAAEHRFTEVRNEKFYVKHQQEIGGYVSNSRHVIQSVYRDAESEIRHLLETSHVAHESTGAKPEWMDFYKRLADVNPVVVLVECPFDVATRRRSLQDRSQKAVETEDHAAYLHELLIKSKFKSDFTIDNSGSFEFTQNQIDEIMRGLMK